MPLDDIFAALADPTRRAMLLRLAKGEASVQELAAPHGLAQPTISKHLKVLENAGLIESRIAGQSRPRRLAVGSLVQMDHWLTEFKAQWNTRLDTLQTLLEHDKS